MNMLKKLNVGHFENLANSEFEFGLQNKVSGKNGSGKSQLFRAFLWCRTGLTPHGTAVPLAECEGWDVTTESVSGVTVRRYVANSQTKIEVNGNPIPVREWETGTKLLAQCLVTFPCAIYAMDEQEREAAIMACLKKPSIEELVRSHYGKKVSEQALKSIDYTKPVERLHELFKSERKIFEKKIAEMEAVLAQTEKEFAAIKEHNSKVGTMEFDEYKRSLELKTEIEKVRKLNEESTTNWQKLAQYERELAFHSETKKAHDEWAKKNKTPQKSAVPEQQLELEKEQLNALLAAMTTAKGSVAEIERKGKGISESIADSQKRIACPTCGRAYDDAESREKTIKTLEDERKTLSVDFKQAKLDLENATKAFTEQQIKVKELLKKVELDNRVEPEPSIAAKPKVPTADMTVHGKTSDENLSVSKVALKKINELSAELAKLEAIIENNKVRNTSELENKLNAIRLDLSKHNGLRDEAACFEEAFHPQKGVEKIAVSMALSQLEMKGVEFILHEQRGQTLQPRFKIVSSSTKLPIDKFSTGQKVKFALYLAERLCAIDKTLIPLCFVEGADTVDVLKPPSYLQIAVERVVKEQPMKLEIMKGF